MRANKNLIFLLSGLMMTGSAHALDIFGRDAANGGQGSRAGLVHLYKFTPGTIPNPGTNKTIKDEANGSPALPTGTSTTVPAGGLDLTVVGSFSDQLAADADVFYGSTRVPDTVTAGFGDIGYIEVRRATLIKSINKAAHLTDACRYSNEMTLEVWLKNERDDQPLFQLTPLKIVSLSKQSNITDFYLGYQYMGAAQFEAAARTLPYAPVASKTVTGYQEEASNSIVRDGGTSNSKVLTKRKFQHVIYTHLNNGTNRLYVSDPMDLPTSNKVSQRDEFLDVAPASPMRAGFSNWDGTDPYTLTVANESTYNDSAFTIHPFSGYASTTESRDWMGEIYLIAVYCKSQSDSDILGTGAASDLFGGNGAPPPNFASRVTAGHVKAVAMYSRLTGVTLPLWAQIIRDMATHINAYLADNSKTWELEEAARIVTSNDAGATLTDADGVVLRDGAGNPRLVPSPNDVKNNFLNFTVRDMAKRMSTREESTTVALNDFTAYFIGLTRDDRDVKELLTGNYFYRGDPDMTSVPSDMVNDFLTSNNHFAALEAGNYDLGKVLKRAYTPPGSPAQIYLQEVYDGRTDRSHPDAAGVLTSQAFMGAHTIAGTNRRAVEFTFKEFMCLQMTQWSNANGTETKIGSDVDRVPAGVSSTFTNTCRGCHSNMDGFRPAFAKFTYSNGFVKYGDYMSPITTKESDETATTMYIVPSGSGIAGKMNRNPTYTTTDCTGDPTAVIVGSNAFCRIGYMVDSDNWVNNAYHDTNANQFGWEGENPLATPAAPPTVLTGHGIHQFGDLVSKSRQFSRCMTQRIFKAVCKRDLDRNDTSDSQLLETLTTELTTGGGGNPATPLRANNLRDHFARVAGTKQCAGF